jgi:peptidoglycan/LPS O-acetylase OafA/YrhL
MVARLKMLFLGHPAIRDAHVAALDGLRGFAVLIVILSHLSNFGWLPQPGLAGTGKSGVYLFFVLSAYLLSHAMLGQPFATLADLRYWINYALRRVLRIWPLYSVVLLVSWLLTRLGVADWHYQIDTAALWGHLTLREGQSVLWSIPVEFTFYLWLPLIVVILALVRSLPLGRWWGLGLLLLSAFLASRCWPASTAEVNDVRLGPYVVVFLCGVAAAWMQRQWPMLEGWPRVWRSLGWLLLALLALTTPTVWARVSDTAFVPELNHRWFMAFGLGWSLLLLSVLLGGGMLGRIFAATPMRLLGAVSFSAYLWHMPILQAAEALGLRALGWAATPLLLIAIFAGAMGSFMLLERPWREVRFHRSAPDKA